MFSTFTTEVGALIIRTENMQRIVDIEGGTCRVCWQEGGELYNATVFGTAQGNLERLKAEELALISAASDRQARAERGLPMLPVVRGGKAAPRG